MPSFFRTVRSGEAWPYLVIALSLIANSPAIIAQSVPSALAHHTAPNFSRQDLNSKKTIQLVAFRGKVVLLNFWATWCIPCLAEMPVFNEWQKEYGPDNFQVIGVSMDDAPANVVSTVAKLKLNYPVLMGDEHLGAAYGGILGLPVTFLIDRRGRVQARYESVDVAIVKRNIERLLESR
jgi:cytochrome c biogenesis protein CcmG, thiol:disulfide interchange protein DsbE